MFSLFRRSSKLSQLTPSQEHIPRIELVEPPKPQLSAPSEPVLQVFENRYIDHGKLIEICIQQFGVGNYKLMHKFKRYYLEVPTALDEHILEQCEISRYD